MILSNFLFRIRQYAHENRVRLARIALYLIAFLMAAVLVCAAAVTIQRIRYEKRVEALERDFHAADARARESEQRADKLEYEIEAREAELAEITARANAADAALKTARGRTITLKEQYETIRYLPVPDTPVSVDGVCAELAALNYPCK